MPTFKYAIDDEPQATTAHELTSHLVIVSSGAT
jgi:hypothetical protein